MLIRVAYFSPLPPARSGIADYSQELLGLMGQMVEMTLFAAEPAQVGAELRQQFEVRPLSAYPAERWRFDIALYHMGNSHHHAEIYSLALRYPGLVVLHDQGLHHLVAELTAGRNNFPAYMRELAYTLGHDGIALAEAIYQGRRSFPTFELPLNRRLIDRSLGLIVHSHAVAAAVRRENPERPVTVVPALMEQRRSRSRRQALGVDPNAVILASTGLVTANKQLDLALKAFARLQAELPKAVYLVVGDVGEDVDLPGLVTNLGLQEAVHCLGYIPDLQHFADWTATADIIVNLRYPTVGETSATALRALAAERPVIVFDHGWYAELPAEIAVKVPPLDEEALFQAMRRLAWDDQERRRMGQAAGAYIKQHHDPARVARQYVDFIKEQLARMTRRMGSDS